MRPSEGEIQAAITAGAQKAWEDHRTETMALMQVALPSWEDLDPMARASLLDSTQPIVWAALQALPDRLDPFRQIMMHHDANANSDSLRVVDQIRKLLRQTQ